MRVLSLVHTPSGASERFGDVVAAEGHQLVEWDLPTQGKPVGSYDAVMVFGGSPNVGEETTYPWLHDEYALLRHWLDDRTPLFGVCLGAQTLAHAAGARVAPLPRQQLGFVATELTTAGRGDPVLGSLPAKFAAFNANGYGFAVPRNGVELAVAGSQSQAFRIRRAWGVQFHPEIRRDQVVHWYAEEPEPPRPLEELTAELDAGVERWYALGDSLCRAFLREAERITVGAAAR